MRLAILLSPIRDMLFPRTGYGCRGKTRYEEDWKANYARRKRMAAPGYNDGELYVYPCARCGGFHLTKHPQDIPHR